MFSREPPASAAPALAGGSRLNAIEEFAMTSTHQAHRRAVFFALLLIVFFAAAPSARANPPDVQLAADGKARLSVIVGPKASERVRQAARTLADYLGRISGATFAVGEGDGRQGIAV